MNKDIKEAPEKVDPSIYSNTDFKPFVVGDSNPLADKINPSLLKDIDAAAKKAGIDVSVTTAVTGHRKGSRHETGHAVDIAMVNGKGFQSEKDAQKKGIYDGMMRFVRELEYMGYIKNSESGNDKAVLTFGFPGHHHHIHVSRKSDDGESTSTSTGTTETNSGETKTDITKVIDTVKSSNSISQDEFVNSIAKVLEPFLGSSKVTTESVVDEINRFRQLIK